MKKLLKMFFVLAVLIYANPDVYAQGNTNSSISGVVYEKGSQTLPGASILAVHTPSGTRYSASTDGTGNFSISNMRVGGPYKVTVSFVGSHKEEFSDVYLELGKTFSLDVVLTDESQTLEEVKIINTNK